MDRHTLQVLEFDKLKEILGRFVSSSLGKSVVDELRPQTHADTIRENLAETTEMARLYEADQPPPLDGLYQVFDPLRRSVIPGAVLDPAEIVLIGETVAAARRIKSALKRTQLPVARIKRYGERIAYHDEIETAIGRVFDEQKQIRDTASHELSKIRKSIRLQRSAIVAKIERLIRKSWSDYLQEKYYTQREGRYVLPVDAHFQNKAPGIIHDRSASGTTVYIEPMEIVEDGNRLKALTRDEEIEIRRILRELTAMIASHADDLVQNLHIFSHLDFLSAKARMSIRYEMNEPSMGEEKTFSLYQARHPLLLDQLGREKVIPLDLALPDGIKGIVITGPNTGGKTVVLKTVGLIVLMAQSGLHVPADTNSELPVFEWVGADIGDEQSLEQNLSTFSSHMRNIRTILETANERSLVLLDELGSGTDPMEGGALSCAILEQLYRQRATFLVSTHLQDIKLYAYQNEGLLNGAMEFDLQSLQPTFAFRLGLPGKSNAIQIANRLGLPSEVIHRAKTTLDQSGQSPEELLVRLGDELRSAQRTREQAKRDLEEACQMRNQAETRLEKARKEAREIIQRAEKKAQNLLAELERRIKKLEKQEQEFRREWEEKLKFADAASQQAAVSNRLIQDAKQTLTVSRHEFEKAKPAARATVDYVEKKHWKPEQLQPGQRVKLAGMSEPAEIVHVFPDKNEVEVCVNALTLRVKPERIVSLLAPKPAPTGAIFSSVKVERPATIGSTVDVHGLTVEEMTPIVQKYLDQAFLAGLRTVTIIHGYGYGILRREIRRLLSENPTVESFQNGMEFEGGDGVTVVNLRQSR